MFTGIVEETGRIRSLALSGSSGTISIRGKKSPEGTGIGDSIAVNGICLTVVSLQPDGFTADVMAETVRRSSLSGCRPGVSGKPGASYGRGWEIRRPSGLRAY